MRVRRGSNECGNGPSQPSSVNGKDFRLACFRPATSGRAICQRRQQPLHWPACRATPRRGGPNSSGPGAGHGLDRANDATIWCAPARSSSPRSSVWIVRKVEDGGLSASVAYGRLARSTSRLRPCVRMKCSVSGRLASCWAYRSASADRSRPWRPRSVSANSTMRELGHACGRRLRSWAKIFSSVSWGFD